VWHVQQATWKLVLAVHGGAWGRPHYFLFFFDQSFFTSNDRIKGF
jgi:hypothetical protein